MSDKESLPDFDGRTAFGGALRFYDPDDDSWEQQWGRFYGNLMPNIKVFAIDAFGTVYGISSNDMVTIFWSETGEVEDLGVGISDFYEMIMQDPDNTINLGLYEDAVKKYGKLSFDEHFAFKIETALGGSLTVDNISVMSADEHFQSLGKLANRIKDIPEGEVISNITIEH